ncbi:MAG: DNA gyrase subunit A [Bacteroidales bacterium]|nr:DNA gyrase subunit A [Bacteroidales bacterium]
MAEGENIIPVKIEEQMKTAYIDYSMSVIVARALPDVRDGFKPVHRRILFGMDNLGNTSDKPHKKSARIVGDVLGKYHPHGDSSVYGALVHMAQPWALRYTLVDGQGNFGSVDGDGPAAMRYTEARMTKMAEDMLTDIDKETVDFVKNFDETLEEPTVLPTRIPNLLINGSSGIAVGMATNMAPHNISDAIDAIVAYVDNHDIPIDELIRIIKAPDFPTGGTIFGYAGVRQAYETGRGRIIIRSKCEFETIDGHDCIVVTEIPYMINRSELTARIGQLVNEKKIDGISDISDQSDTNTRIVIELRKDAMPQVVLNHLYKNTALQSSFCVNNIALVNGRPQLLNLQQIIKYFVDHRHEVIIRRSQFEKRKAEERVHILEGLIIACDNIDEVVKIIRGAESIDDARAKLMERFDLTDIQARAIVEMRLRQLTGLEQDKLHAEYDKLKEQIAYLEQLLANEDMQMGVIKKELLEIKDKYGDERRTNIEYSADEFNPEDFYADDEVVVTVSHMGYIKRTLLSEFKAQSRGGVGSKGSNTRDQDFIEHLYFAKMHDTMMFFTRLGRCFWYKVYDIPEGNKASKGRAIQNILNIEKEDCVKAFITVRNLDNEEYVKSNYIIMATKQGVIKKSLLENYSRPRQNGVIAITVKDGDELLRAVLTDGKNEIMMATRSGRAIRFNEDKIRCIGRTGAGVKGVTLNDDGDDCVVGFVGIPQDSKDNILVLSEKGFGKRSEIDDYRITNRGGKGVITIKITEKTGNLIAIDTINDDNDLMIINRSGITIRIPATDIRTAGRATQGVKLINLSKKNDEIASGTIVPHENETEEESAEGEGIEISGTENDTTTNDNENNSNE